MKIESKLDVWRPVTIGDIPIGTVFYGDITGGVRLYLRHFSGVVDLENPHSTFSNSSDKYTVDKYRPVEAKVVVEG